ncbi:hypothetical protein EDB85DRAFT_2160526 [Lactarius pseudohatsudake]|nr:hypothetical protein EDB85DRAFT_2160526 [Lactarius pseudohatsudake]
MTTPTTTASTFPPKLTGEERRLLQEHEGCFKCRVFYAGHRADKCAITLSGKNYRTLTVQDALRAKPTVGKANTWSVPVGAIADTSTNADLVFEPLAAIFPSTSMMAENSFSDASENSLSLSTTLHAVIAPGLCAPVILGLPFLSNNKIVCNYAERTCLVTGINPPYDLLAPSSSQNDQGHPDILGVIWERIGSLELEAELAEQEKKMRQRFAVVFEPLPHVDE